MNEAIRLEVVRMLTHPPLDPPITNHDHAKLMKNNNNNNNNITDNKHNFLLALASYNFDF